MNNVLDNPEVRLRQAAKQIELTIDAIDDADAIERERLGDMADELRETAQELEALVDAPPSP